MVNFISHAFALIKIMMNNFIVNYQYYLAISILSLKMAVDVKKNQNLIFFILITSKHREIVSYLYLIQNKVFDIDLIFVQFSLPCFKNIIYNVNFLKF